MKNTLQKLLPVFILVAALAVSAAIAGRVRADATASSSATASITFPIPELGGCTDVQSCKKYCDDPANITACVTFAEAHGLMSHEDADRAKEFSDVLKDKGPGGCTSRDSCEAYCNDVRHMSECVSFAEAHHIMGSEELGRAKKILAALQAGAQLPGGCTSKDSCEKYCSDSAHADECVAFAEKAGFMSSDELDRAKKILPLIKSGETPGGCTSKDQCEEYCSDSAHTQECVAFAEKAGLMSKEEADMVRKTGGKGPGGCNSRESCDAFCNKPENQDACFKFAEEHDLIPQDKLQEIKDGMGRLRAGISQAPDSVVSCLKDKLGSDIVDKIQNGTFTPGENSGETIKDCFEAAMPEMRAKMEKGLEEAPDSVKQCLNNAVGSDELEKIKNGEAPTPKLGDAMRNCFEGMQREGLEKLREGLGKMPPAVRACIEAKLGKDTIAQVESSGTANLGPETKQVFTECMQGFKEGMQGDIESRMQQLPPEVRDCVKAKLDNMTAGNGEKPSAEEMKSAAADCMKDFKPQGAPQGVQSFTPPTGAPPPGGAPSTDQLCANFASVPSCDLVPDAYRDTCQKCKGQ